MLRFMIVEIWCFSWAKSYYSYSIGVKYSLFDLVIRFYGLGTFTDITLSKSTISMSFVWISSILSIKYISYLRWLTLTVMNDFSYLPKDFSKWTTVSGGFSYSKLNISKNSSYLRKVLITFYLSWTYSRVFVDSKNRWHFYMFLLSSTVYSW